MKMSAIDLAIWVVLAGLANYKAAHMLSQDGEDGPFEVFKKWRAYVGETTWIGRGFHCFSCTSFWGALIAALLIIPIYTIPLTGMLVIWGAIAAISFAFWRYFG